MTMYDDIDYVALGRRVEESVRRGKRTTRLVAFGVSVLLFVVFVLIAWLIVPTSSGDPAAGQALASGVITLTIGWAASLFLQGAAFITDTAAGERQARQQAVARELQRILEERALDELRAADYGQRKAKRDERLEIGADGELVELVDARDDSARAAQTGR